MPSLDLTPELLCPSLDLMPPVMVCLRTNQRSALRSRDIVFGPMRGEKVKCYLARCPDPAGTRSLLTPVSSLVSLSLMLTIFCSFSSLAGFTMMLPASSLLLSDSGDFLDEVLAS